MSLAAPHNQLMAPEPSNPASLPPADGHSTHSCCCNHMEPHGRCMGPSPRDLEVVATYKQLAPDDQHYIQRTLFDLALLLAMKQVAANAAPNTTFLRPSQLLHVKDRIRTSIDQLRCGTFSTRLRAKQKRISLALLANLSGWEKPLQDLTQQLLTHFAVVLALPDIADTYMQQEQQQVLQEGVADSTDPHLGPAMTVTALAVLLCAEVLAWERVVQGYIGVVSARHQETRGLLGFISGTRLPGGLTDEAACKLVAQLKALAHSSPTGGDNTAGIANSNTPRPRSAATADAGGNVSSTTCLAPSGMQ